MKVTKWDPAFHVEFPARAAHLVGERAQVVTAVITAPEAHELLEQLAASLGRSVSPRALASVEG